MSGASGSASSLMTVEQAREAAAAYAKAHPDYPFAWRSCWVCNPAHQHFLSDGQAWLLNCFDCGHWFYGGVDITEPSDD